MVGEVWTNIPGYEERGTCRICNTLESMEHILTICKMDPVRIIWALAKEMWPYDPLHWPEINIGTILGSGCLTTPPLEDDEEARVNPMKK